MPSQDIYLVTDVIGLPNAQAKLLPLENALLKNFENIHAVQAIHDAIAFATVRHGGQKRNTGEPQMVHPLRAMTYAYESLKNQPNLVKILQVIALHDTIEDTPTTRNEIAKLFGKDVAQAVDILSKKRNHVIKETYEGEMYAYFEDLLALQESTVVSEEVKEMVFYAKVADRLENIDTLETLVKPGTLDRRKVAIERQKVYIDETRKYILPLLPEGTPLRSVLEKKLIGQEVRLALPILSPVLPLV